jgi:trigger factor
MHRAQRAGVAPQQYYDQLVRSGAAGVIFGDVRRGKMLASLLERVVIEDTNGERLTLADLRGALGDDGHDHDEHEGHDHD